MDPARINRINQRFTETAPPPKDAPFLDEYLQEPLVSLENALREVSAHITRLNKYIEDAFKQCNQSDKYGLTKEESAAIYLYTMDWKEGSAASLYYNLNDALRSGNRSKMKSWFPYLKLLVTALDKFPSVQLEVWRNLSGDFSKDYPQDKVFPWPHVTSCSRNVNKVIQCFYKPNEPNTLFKINTVKGKNISAYSQYPDEDEVVLLPGARFRVTGKSVLDKIANCTNISITHLQEL